VLTRKVSNNSFFNLIIRLIIKYILFIIILIRRLSNIRTIRLEEKLLLKERA